MKKIINKTTLITALIIFSYIFICSLFMQSNVSYNQNQFISLLFALPIIFIFYKISKLNKYKDISLKKTIIFLIIYFAIVSIIQIIVLRFLSVNPGWDFGVLFSDAVNYANTGSRKGSVFMEYFQYYPNNIMLFKIMTLFIKVGNLFGIKAIISCYIMNILFIDFALLLLFLVLKKKFGISTGFAGLIISLFFLPLFLYTPVFYSDTMSLFIPLLILLLYLYVDKEKTKRNYIIFLLLGIVLFFGFQLKISSIFILIAIIIDYIINHKKIIINLIIMTVTFLLLNFLFKTLIVNNPRYEFKQNDYGKYPFTHWIMMGVEDIDKDNSGRNSYGGYSGTDFDMSRSYKTGNDAMKFNISEYFNRVNKMGMLKYGEFLTRKGVNIWTDGYYYSDVKLSISPKDSDNKIRDIMYNNKTTKYLLINFTQGVQYAFILIMIFGIIKQIKNKSEYFDYLLLTLIGLFVFFLFWGARSRYIFNYVPIFIVIIIKSLVGGQNEKNN